jgi:prepilin-type N-terminal cleavage/methylation domain-containing protein
MANEGQEGGFTLIEVVVTLALLGIMMAVAVSGWSSWSKASEHVGTAREIQSVLRQTQQRAVTEGGAMCVLFDVTANAYTAYRGACADTAKALLQGPIEVDSADVQLSSPAFGSPSGPGVTFYARGTALPGTVKVIRPGSPKEYVVSVEGLTGRAFLR